MNNLSLSSKSLCFIAIDYRRSCEHQLCFLRSAEAGYRNHRMCSSTNPTGFSNHFEILFHQISAGFHPFHHLFICFCFCLLLRCGFSLDMTFDFGIHAKLCFGFRFLFVDSLYLSLDLMDGYQMTIFGLGPLVNFFFELCFF